MEIKKSFKADLGNKRSLLLEIGLVVALSLVILAFAYTPKEYRIEQVATYLPPVETEMVPVTTEQPKKGPKPIRLAAMSNILQVIKNDNQMQTDINPADLDVFDIVEVVPQVKDEQIEDETIFLRAETMPSFQGGDINAFRVWVLQNVRFPQLALENGVKGRVVLSFVIDKDGRLTNIEVLQSPDRTLSEEAVRVLNGSPKWSPGKQRNQVVRVKYTLPVDFRMQN